MILMNSKIYWIIHNVIEKIVFYFKSIIFRIVNCIESVRENNSFIATVLLYTLRGFIVGLVVILIVHYIDGVLCNCNIMLEVDISTFVDVIIGGIGIAGIILGLYCSNIISIYSTKYAKAPDIIANAFRSDLLTKKCINGIVVYIIFGLLLISEVIIHIKLNWASFISFIFFSVLKDETHYATMNSVNTVGGGLEWTVFPKE